MKVVAVKNDEFKTMITSTNIFSFIQSILKDWLPVKPMPIVITTFNGSKWNAAVSYLLVKEGLKYHRDENTLELSINEKLLKKDWEYVKRTLTHETYHIIQRHYFSNDEMRKRSLEIVPDNRISEYTPNINELEAEVFTINLCGSSTHSYRGAKELPLYREILNNILDRSEEIPGFSLDIQE